MRFSTGPSERSWQPVATSKTNTAEYWLNWRVLICSVWVLSSVVMAGILIWKYEGSTPAGEDGGEAREEPVGTVYDDESWRPCLKEIHPAWLLIYRAIAFLVLLALLITIVAAKGGEMFYYYTQWTFALVTVYFGIGSLLSIYGCYGLLCKVDDDRAGCVGPEAENAPRNAEDTSWYHRGKRSQSQDAHLIRRPVAGFWGYTFQIIYQMNAGAVMLTDCVFWLIIVPFLAIKDYSLNFFMIGLHSVNAIFLLGDTALNSLRFPWFRISYFFMWTVAYVIFQWVALPFLDLASPYAPVWYFLVAMMHIPCYAIFSFIIKSKHLMFSRLFPQSYLHFN
ncbi:unnamed protein product [Spirodela intermedia]|uniref:Uncharacterized protein n=1 Tax=Spirodela intermedia TaxID=51605 RepID=A0A7I8IW39_SPIIN|nr:unnamed protein product [Spirodela intermedia]CAA6661218.1 unnamed protein product [Spirodela intermedia]